MAKHEFGIMQMQPKTGERYDTYEPERYECISVDDEYIEEIDSELLDIMMYWHTIDCPKNGLAYCGVTLIPPNSVDAVLNVTENNPALFQLSELLIRAKTENKFIIHYGL